MQKCCSAQYVVDTSHEYYGALRILYGRPKSPGRQVVSRTDEDYSVKGCCDHSCSSDAVYLRSGVPLSKCMQMSPFNVTGIVRE